MPRLALALGTVLAAAPPHLQRVTPLGAQSGTTAAVTLAGQDLADAKTVTFDTPDITWLGFTKQSATVLEGTVRIAPGATLGLHRVRIQTAHGPSNTRLFNINQFPSVDESEPNDTAATAQSIPLRPQVLHGYMKKLADIDFFTFDVRAGERWLFDLQSIERGGFLECSLTLYDSHGKEVAFNEDQDEYLETPRLAYTFPAAGTYRLKVDQYRGPQGVSCDDNCGYQLQISQLPVIVSAYPLGAEAGAPLRLELTGEALQTVRELYLTPVRGAEYARLTFPFSMPVRTADPAPQKITAIARHATATTVQADFRIPANAPPGLWKLWTVSPQGVAEGISLEITAPGKAGIDGQLPPSGTPNAYPVNLTANVPFHAWTLAAQLGLPFIDTVLELYDGHGKLLAEHDDLMSGQGTVLGNPDSSLYYTPRESGPAKLLVRDRTNRGGPTYAYRLHMDNEPPGFQLLTEPEEFTVASGATGEMEVLLIRQPGFAGAVEVWAEGLPPGATATRGNFRADQPFGPSGDGDNVLIPTVALKFQIPAELPPGNYPIRIFGRSAPGAAPVEAFTTLWIGPHGKRNDTRRPLPRIVVHVVKLSL